MTYLKKLAGDCFNVDFFRERYPRIKDFIQLCRLDRPIGIYLLLWPTLWALWLSAGGLPSLKNLFIFVAGVVLMRSAGCVINDYADRHFDGNVKRTVNRPLVTGKIKAAEALVLFSVLVLVAFLLVLFTNYLTIALSLGGLALASFYPFAKRYTHFPQIVLGAAFGWAIPMAYAAESGDVNASAWLLFIGNLFWTVAYDTQYAMVDRDDDLKIGIKSTAVLFGDKDNLIVGMLQVLALITFVMVGVQASLGITFYLSLFIASVLFLHQQARTKERERNACFKAFLSNHWVGAVIFLGIAFGYL
ncbi:4-hydroxybenzoate polyprenyltransferase [Endozoicomonas sp. (ex Bugula neritina AB1)]|nr:4-hydroxybenzoate polyprenyltransferase [Endozoicomonas sp. (ex Bugula neritina AB1)]